VSLSSSFLSFSTSYYYTVPHPLPPFRSPLLSCIPTAQSQRQHFLTCGVRNPNSRHLFHSCTARHVHVAWKPYSVSMVTWGAWGRTVIPLDTALVTRETMTLVMNLPMSPFAVHEGHELKKATSVKTVWEIMATL
jgi:hypothetical protein